MFKTIHITACYTYQNVSCGEKNFEKLIMQSNMQSDSTGLVSLGRSGSLFGWYWYMD